MNILNIDLDFFQDRSVYLRRDDPAVRPDDEGIVPWSADDVDPFLEKTLNIGMNHAGAVVQSHDEVFYEWKRLIEINKLTVPFRLVHVDAHSDLVGMDQSWVYLHSDFLSLKVEERPKARRGDNGLNFSNYLAFAFGCRWISEADFIINHNWEDDIPRQLLSENSWKLVKERFPSRPLPYADYSFEIELMRIPRRDTMTDWNIMEERRPIGEPRTPFNIVTLENIGTKYLETSWDYVFLSHSPGYVPSYADPLLDVIRKYIGSPN